MKRRWQQRWQADNDIAGTSRHVDINRDSRSNESMYNDPILEPKHEIFLSHSGAQKDFVDQLCVDLERCHYFPFFDKRPSSLPKGERFPELILKAAKQCYMAVVVLSEEYFLSKWPMIELHTFVQARKTSNTKLKILPLFYKLTVKEFGNEGRQKRWFEKWEEWAISDAQINISEWKECLKVIASFNGIEYNLDSKEIIAYQKSIVSNISQEVRPQIKWDDIHVQGRSNLCKTICQKIHQTSPSSLYKIRVVGLFGVGGIGKTTICKSMCNEFFQEFEGKVSHIELGSRNPHESLKEVVKDLIGCELLQESNEAKYWHILRQNLHKEKTFLALDNVWDDFESIDKAKMYLNAHHQIPEEGRQIHCYHEQSMVMVTSRSLETLSSLGIDKSHCFEMPELQHEDAMTIFLNNAAHGKQYFEFDDINAIEQCVKFCYFHKGGDRGSHYLPLALKALGVQMGCVEGGPSHWVKALAKGNNFNYLHEQENHVFNIFRISFDRLIPYDQNLFMDAVLYCPSYEPLMQWLSILYDKDLQEIGIQLHRLKRKALLEDVDMASQRISVHDLWREFAKLEAGGELNGSAAFGKRRWAYYEDTSANEHEEMTCWQNLTRMGILSTSGHGRYWNQGIEWDCCSNIMVLELIGLSKLPEDFNLKGLKRLRSLDVIDVHQLDSQLDGLQDLNNLVYFSLKWYYDCSIHGRNYAIFRGQLPASLKTLKLRRRALHGLMLDVFFPGKKSRVPNLGDIGKDTDFILNNYLRNYSESLQLERLQDHYASENLDFSSYASLKTVTLDGCNAGDLNFRGCTLLQLGSFWLENCRVGSLDFSGCTALESVTLCDSQAAGNLDLSNCTSLKTVNLSSVKLLKTVSELSAVSTPALQSLSICFCDDLVSIRGSMAGLQELRELKWRLSFSNSIEVPNLSGCKQLEVVDFENNPGLRSLKCLLWDLPNLRILNLTGCILLSRLPDLSCSRNLQKLGLDRSGVKIREEDIFWIATAPHLRRVPGWF